MKCILVCRRRAQIQILAEENNDHLNFVISKNQANKINGMLGFLKASTDDDATVWTTMWKVLKSSSSPMLGIEILNFLRKQGYKSVMSLGINCKTEEIWNRILQWDNRHLTISECIRSIGNYAFIGCAKFKIN